MDTQNKEIDLSQVDSINLSAYVRKGTFAARPLHWQGITQVFMADECLIRCLDISDEGTIYGGTGNKAAHAFQCKSQGALGFIREIGGSVENGVCAAICCHKEKIVAFINDDIGVRVMLYNYDLPFGADPIQEYHNFDFTTKDLGYIFKSMVCRDAVRDNTREHIIAIAGDNLFSLDVSTGKTQIIDTIPTTNKIVVDANNNAYGLDTDRSLWKYSFQEKSITRNAIKLPAGMWEGENVCFCKGKHFYISNSDGEVYSIKDDKASLLFQTHQAPITTMSITPDRRIFGFCGNDMQNMFVFDLNNRCYENLGVAVSTLERIRYGYEFSASVTGNNGEIFFAECDNNGHLWQYMPWLLSKED